MVKCKLNVQVYIYYNKKWLKIETDIIKEREIPANK